MFLKQPKEIDQGSEPANMGKNFILGNG